MPVKAKLYFIIIFFFYGKINSLRGDVFAGDGGEEGGGALGLRAAGLALS